MSLIFTFITGGVLCAAAQILIDKTRLSPARILVGYVLFGILLFATGLYDPLFRIAGCGASIPLVGFGAAVGRGVKAAVDSDGILGVLTGGLSATSAGITAAIFLGFFLCLFVRGRHKKM